MPVILQKTLVPKKYWLHGVVSAVANDLNPGNNDSIIMRCSTQIEVSKEKARSDLAFSGKLKAGSPLVAQWRSQNPRAISARRPILAQAVLLQQAAHQRVLLQQAVHLRWRSGRQPRPTPQSRIRAP